MTYPFRKVWREGLEVAIKIKGSQGQRRVVWLKVDHPFTAISPASEVHANHNEANNAAIRRRCSAYCRRQNLYAKTTAGLQRSLDVQRLIHNWVRPHWGLGAKTTPAIAAATHHSLNKLPPQRKAWKVMVRRRNHSFRISKRVFMSKLCPN